MEEIKLEYGEEKYASRAQVVVLFEKQILYGYDATDDSYFHKQKAENLVMAKYVLEEALKTIGQDMNDLAYEKLVYSKRLAEKAKVSEKDSQDKEILDQRA